MATYSAPGWAIARAAEGADGEVIAADQRFRTLLRVPADQAIVGRPWSTMVSGRSSEALHHAIETLRRNESWGGALEMLVGDNAQPLRVDVHPAYDGDQRLVVIRVGELTTRRSGIDPEIRLAIMETMAARLDPQATAFAVLQEIRHAIAFDWGVVLRFDEPPAHTAEVMAAYPSGMAGAATGAIFVPDFPERILAESGEPSIAGDLTPDRSAQSPLGRLPAFGMNSAIRLPLFGIGRVVGCLILYAHETNAFDALDGLALEQYVRPLGGALAATAPHTPADAAPTDHTAADYAAAAPTPSTATATAPPTRASAADDRAASADPDAAVPRGTSIEPVDTTPPTAAPSEPPPADPTLSPTAASESSAEEEARAQRDGLSQLGSLVSGVAHELNNPLTAILGYAQMLPTLAGDDASKAIHTIEQEAIRAGRIVRNLLYFARQHRPRVDEVDLNALLLRVIEVRRYHFAVDNIEITHHFTALPVFIGDQYQLEQVFLNLLNNAHQALRPESGTITVRSAVTDEHVRITITDTGPGIPEGIRKRIFEPFFTTREVGQGTGLGLSIAYGIVLEHNGRLWAEPGDGGGARLVVELPLPDTTAPPPTGTAPASQALAAGSPGGHCVLVVDDEEPIRTLLSEILSARGFTVVLASSSSDAIGLLAKHPIEIVVCDVRMPGGSGYDFRDHLAAHYPDLADHFLFVTGDIERDRRDRTAIEHVPFLEKPFTTTEFIDAITAIVPAFPPPSGEKPSSEAPSDETPTEA